jgi:hypothetical protein
VFPINRTYRGIRFAVTISSVTRATRVLGLLAAIVVAATLLACPPQNLPGPIPPAPIAGPGYQPPEPAHHPDAGPARPVAAAGAACTSGAECESGVCEGPGCAAGDGVCAPRQRACTFDIATFCGCDGATFDASGTCPERRYAHRGACTVAPGGLADGATCLAGDECASGVCEGQGCGDDAPGICAPSTRRCTRDRRAYCGCDNVTFYGSGSCPGRRYLRTGACGAQ